MIDPKTFAERHSPFFGGSPVKSKQSKANEANVSFCSIEVPPSQVMMGEEGEAEGVRRELGDRIVYSKR